MLLACSSMVKWQARFLNVMFACKKKDRNKKLKKIHSELGICRDGKRKETRVDLRKSPMLH